MAQLTGPAQLYNIDTLRVDNSQINSLGIRAWDGRGNEYVYLRGTANVSAGTWIVYDEEFTTTQLQANEVGPVAIAATAIGVNQYGWFQIYGKNSQASTDTISADRSLFIDDTVGRVDDLGVSGDIVVGAYSMSASLNNVATVYIAYPHVSDELGGGGAGVAGADTQVQFNDGNAFGADGGFVFNKTTDVLTATTFVASTGSVYVVGANYDVAIADGGTGTSLIDPGADRILFWDDSENTTDWLTPGSGLTISGKTITSSGVATASVQCFVFDTATDVTAPRTGAYFIHADSRIAGRSLREVHARHLQTAPAGSGTLIEIRNTGTSGTAAAGTAMLSTNLYIDMNESRSDTSQTAVVVSATGSAVIQNDLIRIDIGSAGTTGSAEGLIVTLGFV